MLGNLSHKTGIGDYGTRNWNHTVGGVSRTLRGGKFIAGFLSAGVTQAFAGAVSGIDAGDGDVSLDGTVTAATVGGATSVLGGSKFGNGAATAAFARLFGQAARAAQQRQAASRALTINEISETQTVFGDKIDYSQVRIIDGKFVPWQGDRYVIAPDGNIYWPGECGNLATCGGLQVANTFIHEMTHTLQVQSGINVLGRGFLLQAGRFLSFGTYNPYNVTYDPSRAFNSYNIEQQGRIAEGIYRGRYPNNINY